ncbi:MAG: hypothetical protein JXQ29_08110 [Planctomycetes bacterium]|nr:hypothetical protein [Planctomycetota bacterium]
MGLDTRLSLLSVLSGLLMIGFGLAIYVPRVRGCTVQKNEEAALRDLETIFRLEQEQQRAGGADAARFLFLPELADVRGATHASERFRAALRADLEGGDLRSGGYRFRVFLPDAEGHGIGHERKDEVNESESSVHLACYAWPERFGTTGRRTFLLVADGTILSTENIRRRYQGRDRAPRPGSGFVAADPDRIVDCPAVVAARDRGRGTDGQIWRRVRT